MNRLASILPPAQVLVGVDATSKKRAFEEAGLLFENLHGLSRALITDSLFARERLGSTGLGHGVAIPHGRIKGLKAPMAALFQLAQPIGFDAPDEQPVNLLIFLLVPEAATQKHLEILSEIAELLSDAPLREKIKASTDAAELHQLIATWQSAQPALAPCCAARPRLRPAAMKPTVVSADVLFEDHRAQLKWEWVAGLGRLRAPLRRGRGARGPLRRRPGRLPQLHPPLPGADPGRARDRLPHQRHGRGLRAPHLAHRHAGAAGAGADRQPGRAGRAAVDVRAGADPDVRHPRAVGVRHRRAARLPVQALRRAHLDARRVHGHPGPGRADHRRVRPGQERAGAGADLARQRPGGRRRGGPVPHQPDHHRGPLPRAAAEPAGSARHRPAGHPRDLRRDGGAPQDAAAS